MSLVLDQEVERGFLTIHLSGKLHKTDYEAFVPAVEDAIERRGKIRMLVEMHDFQGWTPKASWEDLKFDLKHYNHIERLAMVGDKRWEKWMTLFCKPFTSAKVRYFPQEEIDQARAWIEAVD